MERRFRSDCKGFTLGEILIATVIMVAAIAMVMNFFVEHLKASFVSDNKNLLSDQIRTFTEELSINGKDATYFRIYNSFNTSDRNASNDALAAGNAGNFLLLVYQSDPSLTTSGVRPISKIVGYFLDASSSTSQGPIRKFSVSFNPASSAALETLIPAQSTSSSAHAIVPLAQGIAAQKLFYNILGQSIFVQGYFVNGTTTRPVTQTYNFTVTPRG